jgi:thiol-disulfide isomerase/thioredoxin
MIVALRHIYVLRMWIVSLPECVRCSASLIQKCLYTLTQKGTRHRATLSFWSPPVYRFPISVAAISLVTAFVFAAAVAPPPRKAPELSFAIPGQGQKQLTDYRGKVVALEFIFTTCPHCQAASKLMSKFQDEYGPRGLQVIDVAINPNADLLVENFAKDFHTTFPVGWTTSQQMQAFMGYDNRYVVPQLVLIDRKGFIHYQTPALSGDDWSKFMAESAIRQHIEELLGPNTSASLAR